MAQQQNWTNVGVNFSGSNSAFANAQRGMANVTATVGDMIKQKTLEDENARRQDNARRLLAIKEEAAGRATIAAGRVTSAYDLSQRQRAATIALGQIKDQGNIPLADAARAKAQSFAPENLPVIPGMSQQGKPVNFSVDDPLLNRALQRDPVAFREQALDQLMQTGNFTKAEAVNAIAPEMASRYPTVSEKSVELKQKILDTAYKEEAGTLRKNTGSSGTGITMNSDGSVSIGSAANKVVSTQKDNPELISRVIEKISISKGFASSFGGWLTGEDKPTKGNLNKMVGVLSSMGYDDTQIARGLEAGVKENWFFDDTLTKGENIAKYMGKPSASIVKTTTKGGVGEATSGSQPNNRMSVLTKNYLAASKANVNSGLRGRATAADFPKFFNKLTPKEEKAQQAKDKLAVQVKAKVAKQTKKVELDKKLALLNIENKKQIKDIFRGRERSTITDAMVEKFTADYDRIAANPKSTTLQIKAALIEKYGAKWSSLLAKSVGSVMKVGGDALVGVANLKRPGDNLLTPPSRDDILRKLLGKR